MLVAMSQLFCDSVVSRERKRRTRRMSQEYGNIVRENGSSRRTRKQPKNTDIQFSLVDEPTNVCPTTTKISEHMRGEV